MLVAASAVINMKMPRKCISLYTAYGMRRYRAQDDGASGSRHHVLIIDRHIHSSLSDGHDHPNLAETDRIGAQFGLAEQLHATLSEERRRYSFSIAQYDLEIDSRRGL